jgi:hypothetical protein
LINKIDWKITLWACIAFFGLDLDRGNLSQANTDNFLEDLGLSTDGINKTAPTPLEVDVWTANCDRLQYG